MIVSDMRVLPQTTYTMDGDAKVWGYDVEVHVQAEEGEVLDPSAWRDAMARFFESMNPGQLKLNRGTNNE